MSFASKDAFVVSKNLSFGATDQRTAARPAGFCFQNLRSRFVEKIESKFFAADTYCTTVTVIARSNFGR